MFWRFCVFLFVGAIMETQCAPAEVSKSKEKVRAYEFGFSIEEQQHRHEKRDENGIVMGEFGFITADGIYHVTVYATDENGKFKILAMKNYPYKSPEKRMMIAMLPPIKMPVVAPPIKKVIPTDTKSCGGCILTKKLVPQIDAAEEIPGNQVFRPLSKTFNEGPVKKAPVPSVGILKPKGTPLVPPKLPADASKPSLGVKTKPIGVTPAKVTPAVTVNGIPVKPGFAPPAIDSRIGSVNSPTASNGVQQTQGKPLSVGGPAKTPTINLQSTTKLTPIAPSAQSIGKGTPSINGIGAGSNGGGGVGATAAGGGGGPLYRFNYVLDYNSHREEGAIDGSKKGDYKTIDEDGIRRIIDYIANENGYQPHIKWVRIPANELPTGENKLKDYEFVWFNRP